MCSTQINVEFSNLTRADGSALYCHGTTVVQAAVYGPKAATTNQENSEKATLEVVFKRKVNNQQNMDNKVASKWIKAALEEAICTKLHPRTVISVVIQEIENKGNLLACALNAACCAVIDAGISMNYLIAASSCIALKDSAIAIESARETEEKTMGRVTAAFNSTSGKVISITTDGIVGAEVFKKCITLCKTISVEVISAYKSSITNLVNKCK